jgi:hypothetical protein
VNCLLPEAFKHRFTLNEMLLNKFGGKSDVYSKALWPYTRPAEFL